MKIVINGQCCDHPAEITLAELIGGLELEPTRVAVELNKQLVRRGEFGQTRLSDDDVIEIVTLVGGG